MSKTKPQIGWCDSVSGLKDVTDFGMWTTGEVQCNDEIHPPHEAVSLTFYKGRRRLKAGGRVMLSAFLKRVVTLIAGLRGDVQEKVAGEILINAIRFDSIRIEHDLFTREAHRLEHGETYIVQRDNLMFLADWYESDYNTLGEWGLQYNSAHPFSMVTNVTKEDRFQLYFQEAFNDRVRHQE